MNTRAVEGVPLLIPTRFHRERKAVAQAVLADLSARIEALPTASRRGTLADAGTDHAKAWALDVIRALPTKKGRNDDAC